ncbi:MAG: cytochrome b [Pseudomonas sp.]|nr:cytochrome b [Pseudomonas sp.]
MSQDKSFPTSAKLLHWLSAILIICMLFIGVTMIQSLATWQNTALQLHQSFGVLVLILVAVRLLNRLRFKAPALPSDITGLQHFAAKATQVLMYALMIALPISGWLMRNAAGLPVSFFGTFELPLLVSESMAAYGLFREAHGIMAWSLFGVIVLHISAALQHGLIRQDSVLPSMLLKLRSPK